jgi:ABC-type multidrug transport system ATPase subunit
MLAIGRALMGRPKLLMLDEPSLGLAPRIVREVLETVSALRQRGVSILIIEQNARAALQIADYGYVLETGAVVLEGPAQELAHNARVVETYLGLGKRQAEARPLRVATLSRPTSRPPGYAASETYAVLIDADRSMPRRGLATEMAWRRRARKWPSSLSLVAVRDHPGKASYAVVALTDRATPACSSRTAENP